MRCTICTCIRHLSYCAVQWQMACPIYKLNPIKIAFIAPFSDEVRVIKSLGISRRYKWLSTNWTSYSISRSFNVIFWVDLPSDIIWTVHRCTGTKAHRCTDAQTHRHIDILAQTHRHTDTQTNRHTDTLVDTQTRSHTDETIKNVLICTAILGCVTHASADIRKIHSYGCIFLKLLRAVVSLFNYYFTFMTKSSKNSTLQAIKLLKCTWKILYYECIFDGASRLERIL